MDCNPCSLRRFSKKASRPAGVVIAGDYEDGFHSAAAERRHNYLRLFPGGPRGAGKRNEPLRPRPLLHGISDLHIGFVSAVKTVGTADQCGRGVALLYQVRRSANAPPGYITRKHNDHVRAAGTVVMYERGSNGGQPGSAGEEEGRRKRGANKEYPESRETPPLHRLILVARILLVEMADRLQELVEPFHLGFVLGPEHAVAPRRHLRALGG